MLCNVARNNKARQDSVGRKLLDPTKTSWANHFLIDNHELVARDGDDDAEYTAEVYDFADPRKTTMRKFSAEVISDRIELLSKGLQKADKLLEVATKSTNRSEGQIMVAAAEEIYRTANAALSELHSYQAIPQDTTAVCDCDPAPLLDLPEHLRKQLIDVPGILPTTIKY
ncbi:hypothetical protein KAI87_12350 [Myxococcota bacterium]|nr:hypothetical protein [Myxococcota bacterium]